MSADTTRKTLSPQQIWQLELLWILLTFIVAAVVLLPILWNIQEYPFLWLNVIYVLVFITVTRYIFLLRLTFLAKRETLKIIIVFLCIPLVFLLVQELNLFQTFLDEQGIEAVVGRDLPLKRRRALAKYIHNEMLLFGVGSIISSVLFPFRLIMSVWRGRNKAGV